MLFKHLYILYSYFYKNEVIGKSILQCDGLVHWKVPEASSRLSTISVHSISGQNRRKLVRASSENRQWLRVVLGFTCGQDVSSHLAFPVHVEFKHPKKRFTGNKILTWNRLTNFWSMMFSRTGFLYIFRKSREEMENIKHHILIIHTRYTNASRFRILSEIQSIMRCYYQIR